MSQIEEVPKMKRYKTIDIARGIAIFGMVFGHCLNWWLTEQDFWLYEWVYIILAPLGVSGFLFISGASAPLAYKKRLMQIEESNGLVNIRLIRNTFMLRALLLLVIALIYNIGVAIMYQDPSLIWSWNVLQTIAISLFLLWPLIKTSKIFRLILGGILLVANQLLLDFLLPYQGQVNPQGIVFYILFNPTDQYVILAFFAIFLLGTVLGDVLYDFNQIEDPHERRAAFKTHLIYISISGVILITFGVLFLFPNFIEHATFSSMVYSLGLICLVYSGIMAIEQFEPFKVKKSYKFFFYYSYYSFTVYIGHNLLYFLFYRQLTVITIWIPLIITMVLLTVLIRIVYKKVGPKASIKFLISAISFVLVTNKEQRKRLIKMNKPTEN